MIFDKSKLFLSSKYFWFSKSIFPVTQFQSPPHIGKPSSYPPASNPNNCSVKKCLLSCVLCDPAGTYTFTTLYAPILASWTLQGYRDTTWVTGTLVCHSMAVPGLLGSNSSILDAPVYPSFRPKHFNCSVDIFTSCNLTRLGLYISNIRDKFAKFELPCTL